MKIPLFDIDNTLIKDGTEAHANAFHHAFRTIYNQPKARKNDIFVDGMIDTQIIVEILKLYNVREEDSKAKMDTATKVMYEYYHKHAHKGEMIPMSGAQELLQRLSILAIPMGLLTGNVEGIGRRKVELAGLKDFFSFGAFGNLAYKRVDLIPIALERARKKGLNIKLTDLVIVGDSPRDIACARAGGLQVIAVGAGNFSSKELRDAGADLVVDTLEEQDKIVSFLEN